MKKFVLALAALAALPTGANAAAFMNGSFETGPAVGGFSTYFAGATDITGWVVGSHSVDYIGGYWQSQDGSRNIDLSGNAPGSISQTFDTVNGLTYTVKFWLAGNPDGGPTIKPLLVDVGGATTLYNFDVTGASRGAMNWVEKSYTFTATGASTTLTFASNSGTAYGPALDNVSVVAVPEPATWAMMIGGLGLVGVSMRRRKTAVSFA
jgi:choice-of-anchor C domain-containing protein